MTARSFIRCRSGANRSALIFSTAARDIRGSDLARVHHVGPFFRLEDQMCAFTVDFNCNEMGYSPDRVDALVWALTELMIVGGERRLLMA